MDRFLSDSRPLHKGHCRGLSFMKAAENQCITIDAGLPGN
jgi:hypothetical protein